MTLITRIGLEVLISILSFVVEGVDDVPGERGLCGAEEVIVVQRVQPELQAARRGLQEDLPHPPIGREAHCRYVFCCFGSCIILRDAKNKCR